MFSRETFWVERHILGHKTGERLGEDLYLKGSEKEYKIASFLE